MTRTATCLLLAAGAAEAVPSVDLDSGALCRPVAAFRDASNLFELAASKGDLTVRLDPVADGGYILTVSRGDEVVLSRTLGRQTCEEAGAASVVILERFIRELPAPLLPAAPVPPPAPVVEAETPPVVVAVVPKRKEEPRPKPAKPEVVATPELPPPPPPPSPVEVTVRPPEPPPPSAPPAKVRLAWEALAGPAALGPTPSTVSGLVVADVGLVVADRLRFGVLGGWSTVSHVPLSVGREERGRIENSSGLLAGTTMVCSSTKLRVCGGLGAGARLISAVATGSLFKTVQALQPHFAGAGLTQLSWSFGYLRLALDGVVLLSPQPNRFGVEGFASGLVMPHFEALVRLAVGVGSPS